MTIGRAGLLGAVVVATPFLATAPRRVRAQGWPGYGHDYQHSCLAVGASQLPQKVRWSTSVDLSLATTPAPSTSITARR